MVGQSKFRVPHYYTDFRWIGAGARGFARAPLKGDFHTNFALQQKTAIDEKKVIRGKLSLILLGSFINIKMKPPMTPHDFFSSY